MWSTHLLQQPQVGVLWTSTRGQAASLALASMAGAEAPWADARASLGAMAGDAGALATGPTAAGRVVDVGKAPGGAAGAVEAVVGGDGACAQAPMPMHS